MKKYLVLEISSKIVSHRIGLVKSIQRTFFSEGHNRLKAEIVMILAENSVAAYERLYEKTQRDLVILPDSPENKMRIEKMMRKLLAEYGKRKQKRPAADRDIYDRSAFLEQPLNAAG